MFTKLSHFPRVLMNWIIHARYAAKLSIYIWNQLYLKSSPQYLLTVFGSVKRHTAKRWLIVFLVEPINRVLIKRFTQNWLRLRVCRALYVVAVWVFSANSEFLRVKRMCTTWSYCSSRLFRRPYWNLTRVSSARVLSIIDELLLKRILEL